MPKPASPLVSAHDLAAELAGPEAPVVLDARWYLTDESRGRAEYDAAHVPGSLFADVGHVFSGPVRDDRRGGRHPLPDREQLQRDLRDLGLELDSRVVVLDQKTSLGAGRVWWVLRDAGLDDVRVLDGGFAAWVADGGEVTTEPTPAPQTTTLVIGGPRLPVLDADQVARAVAAGHRVVDVRAAERFRGDTEPMDPVAGHIPGADNLPATTLQRADGRFESVGVLRERLAGLGVGDAFSCGSGITASQALLAAEAAGVTGVGLYAGSWSDWVSDSARPVATGD